MLPYNLAAINSRLSIYGGCVCFFLLDVLFECIKDSECLSCERCGTKKRITFREEENPLQRYIQYVQYLSFRNNDDRTAMTYPCGPAIREIMTAKVGKSSTLDQDKRINWSCRFFKQLSWKPPIANAEKAEESLRKRLQQTTTQKEYQRTRKWINPQGSKKTKKYNAEMMISFNMALIGKPRDVNGPVANLRESTKQMTRFPPSKRFNFESAAVVSRPIGNFNWIQLHFFSRFYFLLHVTSNDH